MLHIYLQSIILQQFEMEESQNLDVSSFLQSFQWQSIFMCLDSNYIFTFNTTSLLITKQAQNKFIQISKYLSQYFLFYLFEQDMSKQAESANKIRGEYCSLCQKLKKNRKISHIDILLMLVSLASKQCIKKYLVKLHLNDLKMNNIDSQINNRCDQCSIQSYLYMILIFQTVGTLVSPKAIDYLKSKYIKQFLFNPQDIVKQYRLEQSMKHLQQRLNHTSKKTLLIERKKNAKSQIKILLNNSLKIKKDSLKKDNSNIYQAENIVHQLLLKKQGSAKSIKKKSISVQIPKVRSFSGFSNAVQKNYGLITKQKDRKYHRINTRAEKYFNPITFDEVMVCNKNGTYKTSHNLWIDEIPEAKQKTKWAQIIRNIKKTKQNIDIETYQKIDKTKLLSIPQNKNKPISTNIQGYQSKQMMKQKYKSFSNSIQKRIATQSYQKQNFPALQFRKNPVKFIKAGLWIDGKLKKKAKVNMEGRYFGIISK